MSLESKLGVEHSLRWRAREEMCGCGVMGVRFWVLICGAVNAGRPKRLRPTADKGRYGSADVVINQAMSTARQAVNDCQNALEILAVSNPTPLAEEEEQAKVCCCGEPHRFSSPHRRPGGTWEQALQIDDDDDDDNDVVEIAFTPGVLSLPQIPISKLLDKEGGKFIKDGFLSAEDIVAHQKGSWHKEPEEIILPESNDKQKGSWPSKEGDNKADDEDDDDDDEFGFSSSPKKGKGKSAALSETEDDGPDWELEDESSSDKEPEQKPEDPYADLWVEHDIMYRQVSLLPSSGLTLESSLNPNGVGCLYTTLSMFGKFLGACSEVV